MNKAPINFKNGDQTLAFRNIMGHFTTGVSIVTTLAKNGAPIGMTVNSFTSVSLNPPLVLVCLNNSAGTIHQFLETEFFAISVLSESQSEISKLFAKRHSDRFIGTQWHKGENNMPLINGAIAHFECKRTQIHDGGDHTILLGEVTRAQLISDEAPLIYYGGEYRELK